MSRTIFVLFATTTLLAVNLPAQQTMSVAQIAIKENKVFVDDGNPDSVAATAYRAICTSPELRRQDFRE